VQFFPLHLTHIISFYRHNPSIQNEYHPSFQNDREQISINKTKHPELHKLKEAANIKIKTHLKE